MTSTTPPPAPPPAHDTPRKVNHTVADDYTSGGLASARTAVARDLDLLPVVSVSYFLNTVVPPISPTVLERVIEIFEEVGGTASSAGHLTGVAKEPAKSGKTEIAAFRPLEKCFNNVVKAFKRVCPNATPRLKMAYDPNKAPVSIRDNKTRPDGTLVLSDTAGGWMDIVLAMEEKLRDDEKNKHDDFLKVIWSGHHILRNDPRRQFAFGITIENVSARFWYFSRSHAMVTQDFNFREDYEPLIKLFACLTFCDDPNLSPSPSPVIPPVGSPLSDSATSASGNMIANNSDNRTHMEMLGYDSTVKEFVDEQGYQQFEILVDGTWYITKAILSDFKADVVRGRATRVWEVYEKGKDVNVTYALKDVWLDSDSQMEGDILNTIREKINDEAFFSRHFLTIIKDWHVEDSNDEPVLTSTFMRGKSIQLDDIQYWIANVASLPTSATITTTNNISMRTVSLGETPRLFAPDREPTPEEIARMFRARKHCRTIFEQVGIPYHNLRHMPDMMTALCETTKALEKLWKAGYVHRDISTGNILWHDEHARLSDLEFAKCMTDSSTHEVKTGTPQFVAVEVREGRYMFRPERQPHAITIDSIDEIARQRIRITVPTFKHNPIHDLESMWWIAIWTLFYFVPDDLAPMDHDANNQAAVFALLFPAPSISTSSRIGAFNDAEYFAHLIECLPQSLESTISLLFEMRLQLLACYTKAEATLPASIDSTAFTEIHEIIYCLFKGIRDRLKITTLRVLTRSRVADRQGGEERRSKKPRGHY